MEESKTECNEVLKRVFIIGCPRSGSTWLSLLLAQHPEVTVFQHAKFMQYLRSLYAWWKKKDVGFGKSIVSVASNDIEPSAAGKRTPLRYGSIFSEKDCVGLCRNAADQVFHAVAKKHAGTKVVVDKTPESLHIASFINKVYPDAIFLHIVRDPRSVVTSLKSAGKTWAKGEFPTKIIDAAEFWNFHVSIGQKVMEQTPNYMQIRYEDLKQIGAPCLKEVYQFLGLEVKEELCTQAFEATRFSELKKDDRMPEGFFRKGELASWHKELPSRDIRMIEHVSAAAMKHLNYEPITSPYRNTPFRLWLYRIQSKSVHGICRFLRRIRKRLYIKWRGRLAEPIPEFIVY